MPSEVSIAGAHHDREPTVEELKRELAQSREQQAVTAEILATISSSATDTSQVFAKIAASAGRLCDAYDALIHQVDGDNLPVVAHHGPIPASTVPLRPGFFVGRAVLDQRTIHVADAQTATDEFPEGSHRARQLGFRTILAVPLIRAGKALGALSIRRPEDRPFTNRQIELVQIFADQAIIAIENTRLFEEVQARTRELQQSLEYQTATGEVLGIISRFRSELQPVFGAILESALRLCEADQGGICMVEGGKLKAIVYKPSTPEVWAIVREYYPRPVDTTSINGRAIVEARVIHVPDFDASAATANAGMPKLLGFRSQLSVPLLRDGQPIGALALLRRTPGPFSPNQITLVETFADQAVIAIENARSFEAEQESKRDLTEALEQQTATADVLKVISRSALDLERVLGALVESAARLCDAYDAVIYQVLGDGLRLVAHHGQIPLGGPVGQYTLPLVRGRAVARAVMDRRTIHVADMLAEADEYPEGWTFALRHGWRTALAVPLVHAGEAIGVIYIRRAEVRPFTERQIELVNTFADQAVIAIENTRLFKAEQARTREVTERTRELTEALEQQTATADVLKVISRSALDLQRVLDALVESAARLCNAYDASMFQVFGDGLRLVAHHGQIPQGGPVGQRTIPLVRGRIAARAVIDRRTIQVADMQAEGEEYPESWKQARRLGYRSALSVPLVHAGAAIGAIFVRRAAVRPFTERQMELLNTFADQAVIAIENTRLFNEIAQKSRELEIASQHKSQFVANMSHELRTPLAAMLGYAELLQEGIYGALPEKSLPILTRIHSNGKHLLGLINTVLDISKIEAGQFNLNIGEYALASIVETVMGATESLAATKKLAFKSEVATGLPYGLGDEQRLTQVLLNLVGNALKFTDRGEVRIVAGAEDGNFAVSVSDTGPGIPPEECERIFEKFLQVDSSNTRAKGGTGLGLAIAREIVAMHGGRIWVESTVGEGSTFRMELPVRAVAGAT